MAWMKFMAMGEGQFAGSPSIPFIGGFGTDFRIPGRGMFMLRYRDDDGLAYDYHCGMTSAEWTTQARTRLRSAAFQVEADETWCSLDTPGLVVWFHVTADGGEHGRFHLEVRSEHRNGQLVPPLYRPVRVSEWPESLAPGPFGGGRSGCVGILTSVLRSRRGEGYFDRAYRDFSTITADYPRPAPSPPRGPVVRADRRV